MTWTESLQAPLQYPGVLGDDTTNLKGSLDSQSVNPIMASAPDLSSLIVVDAALPELEQLIAGLNNSNILLLDRKKDGVAQITTALAASQGTINALHIISHGSDGSISLGNTALNAASLGQYSDTLTQWSRHFSPSGDILVYGCEVGGSEQGQDFLTQLSQLTGADVAASNDLTGAEGDWDLEVSTGAIESAIALDANAQANYQGTLATYNGKEYILTNGSKTWLEAEAEAVSQGGHLVTINDLAEETWLRDTFGSTEGFWIGINDINQEGQFEWVNGEAVTYTNWAPGEPNNAGGNQDYGLMNFRSIRQWDDSSPGSTLRGIIEIETDNPPPPSDNGNGLRGEYFDNINFTNQTFIRTDATVNFDWGGGSPDPRIGADTFSVRWTGQVQPRYSENYTFFTTSDDGIRLTVNGQTIIDRFVDQAPTTVEGQIRLDAGQKYDIELEYYENGGGAVAELAWQSNSQNRQIIPQSQLFSSTGSGQSTIILSQDKYQIGESGGTARLELERSGDASQAASVQYQLFDGTATAGADYNAQNGTVNFPAGQTRATIPVAILNDNQAEPTENLNITILGPTGATLGTRRTALLEILDDDAPSSNGDGLKGEYFDNINFTNPILTRTDASVNFNWGNGSPDNSIGSDTFSVRWTGQILPRYSEEYTFFTTSDDGIRLQVNGQTIIDRFVDQPPTTVEGQIRLDAGQKYDIELEYYENGGGAVAELAWQSNSQNRQIIPQSQLFSSTGGGGNAGSFRVEQASFSVDENDGNASVVVERIGGSSGTAQISYGTTNGSAQAGSDFTNQTGTLTFTNGQTRKTVLIPVTNDNLSEPNETFRFNLSNPTGGASLDSSDTSTITIVDDDDGSFINEVFASGFVLPTAFDWSPDQSLMFVAQKAGQVKVINNGSLQSQNFIDLSDEVNGTRDRGLLGLAVHPDFNSGSPYVYLGYTYDPPEADRTGSTSNTLDDADGRGNRPSRVVRITAEQRNGNWVAQSGSQVVILGRNSTWANTNGTGGNSTTDLTIPPSGIRANGTNINDYLATDSESHTIGQLRFGTDGSLFVSNGDGTSYNTVDPRTTRVQDINNLSGKLLRIDPITGRGLSDNPFYDGNANSNRSKVYAYGFRNPFRFTINPQTGQPFVGDVGWFTWEEVNAVERGQNYGWPLYEGGLNGQSERTERYQDAPEFTPLYAGVTNLQAPLLALPHANRGGNARAIVMGDFYTGNTFPSIYQNSLFINDADNGNLQALLFDSSGNLTGVKDFNETIPGAVQISTGQDGNLYFASLATGAIRRFRPGASAAARSREASAQPNFIDRPAEGPPAQ